MRLERRAKVGRNDDCPCGSGRKYKHCHLPIDDAEEHKKATERAEEARRVEEERIAAGYGTTEHYHPTSRKVPAVERADFRALVARLPGLGVPMLVHTPQDLARDQQRLDEALAYARERGVTIQFSHDVPQQAVDGLQSLVDGMYGRDVYLLRQSGAQLHGYGTTRLVVRDGQRIFLLANPVLQAAQMVLRETAIGEALGLGIPGSVLSLVAVLGGLLRHLVAGCLDLPEWARANLGMLIDAVIADITDTAEAEEGLAESAVRAGTVSVIAGVEDVATALAALPFALGLPEAIDDPAPQLSGMGLEETEAARLTPHLERIRDDLPWVRAAADEVGAPWESPEAFAAWHDRLVDIPELAALLELMAASELDDALVAEELAAEPLTDTERLIARRLLVSISPPTTDQALVHRLRVINDGLRERFHAPAQSADAVVLSEAAVDEPLVEAVPIPPAAPLPLPPVFTDPTLFADIDEVRSYHDTLREGVTARRLQLQSDRQDAAGDVEARRQDLRQAETALTEVDARLTGLDEELTTLGAAERTERARAVARVLRSAAFRLRELEVGWNDRTATEGSVEVLQHRQTLSDYEVAAQRGLLDTLPARMRIRLEEEAREAREALGLHEPVAAAVVPVVAVSGADGTDDTVTVVLPLAGGVELAPHSLAVAVAGAVCSGVAEGIDAMERTVVQVTHEAAGHCSLLRFRLTVPIAGSDALDYVQIGIDGAADANQVLRQTRISVRCFVAADLDDAEVVRALLLNEDAEGMG